MDLSTIKNTANWGSSAANLNENFTKVGTEVDKLKYAAYNSKLYATEALLKQSVPSPKVGDWAIVGDTIPGEIYQCKTDGVWTATGQTGGGYGMEVVEKNVTEQHITEVHNEYTGDIVNNPDDEDLYSEEVSEGKSVLKLADKVYNASSFSGMGRAYLRKNITGGKNVLTQAMMDKANTRYVIQYDYDLNGETITVPEGCTLDFQGGSLRNGTLVGKNTVISADIVRIFDTSLEIIGSWGSSGFYPEWFGAKGDGIVDDTAYVEKAFGLGYNIILSPNSTYRISKRISVKSNIQGNHAKLYINNGSHSFLSVSEDNCIIENVELYSNGTSTSNGYYGIEINSDNNIIKNCYIHDITYSAVMVYGKDNVIDSVIAYNCGWDLMSNYGSSCTRNKAINCIARECVRHGFSTDPGTSYIEFINCSAINIGSDKLNEGHTCYHFEGCNYGKVVNCIAYYDSNLSCGESAQCYAVRIEDSEGCIVDGLRISVMANVISTIFVIGMNSNKITNIATLRNSYIMCESPASIYLGGNAILYIESCQITGNIKYIQYSYNSTLNISNSILRDITSDLFYKSSYGTNKCNINGNTFTNCKKVIQGRFLDSSISNNIFNNVTDVIYINNEESNSNNKTVNTVINGNKFMNISGTTIKIGWWDGTQGNIASNNVFAGNINTVLDTSSYGKIRWTGNKRYTEATITNPSIGNGMGLSDELKSSYDIPGSGKGLDRPTLDSYDIGFMFFDTNIMKPIYWSGTKWVDASGGDI